MSVMIDLFQNIANYNAELNLLFMLAFFTTLIVFYSVFVFYFYKFLAKKNILELNLSQYNQYDNPTAVKIFAIVFYLLEYVLLLPFFTLLWFIVLAALISVLGSGLETSTVLLISAALVASIRVTAYINHGLSNDLAKMVPFTFLAIAITTSGFFEVTSIMSRIVDVPLLFSDILYYLLFIVFIEILMRIAEFFSKFK